jgi:hypothetical protein
MKNLAWLMKFSLTATSTATPMATSTSDYMPTIVQIPVRASPPPDDVRFADAFFSGMALASCVGTWPWPPSDWSRHRHIPWTDAE